MISSTGFLLGGTKMVISGMNSTTRKVRSTELIFYSVAKTGRSGLKKITETARKYLAIPIRTAN